MFVKLTGFWRPDCPNLSGIMTFLAIISITFSSFSQLSGYYVIGGTKPNYLTINEALNDLYSEGIEDDVTFALSPGSYPGFTINIFDGGSDSAMLTIESVPLDSTAVTITGTVKFYETKYVRIRQLTISTGTLRAIDFKWSFEIYVQSCVILSNYDAGFQDGAIKLIHYFAPNWSRIFFDRCTIQASSPCILNLGDHGRTTITNCEITSSGEWAIETWFSYLVNLENNLIHGGLDAEASYLSKLKGNTIYGPLHLIFRDSVVNNTIYTDQAGVSANYYLYNSFYLPPDVKLGNSGQTRGENWDPVFRGNYFECGLDLNATLFVTMTDNVFKGNVHLSFNKGLLFKNNVMHGSFDYGDVWTGARNFTIQNNLFIGGEVRSTGYNSNISYNNFVDGADLYLDFSEVQVHDNNFCRGVSGSTSPGNIDHNNYFPMIYCFYDTNSMHYDPGYDIQNPGIATNPILQGKGWSEAPEDDFSGNERKNPPAIGANEIYICSDSSTTNLQLPCGEETWLNLCNLPDTGSFYWSPDTCIQFSDSAYTKIMACEDRTWYLFNSVFGLIDSVSVDVIPFQVEIAEMPLFYCGYARTLNATYHPNAAYHWTPENGLSNPNIRNPLLNIEDSTYLQYVLECTVPGCGTTYDTLDIEFDPMPNIAFYYPDQQQDTVYYSCYATCVDEFLWDFGDGSQSDEQNPIHIYSEPGTYHVSLTGSNEYGSRTIERNFYFGWVGFRPEVMDNILKVYPNPADECLLIRDDHASEIRMISITDIYGHVVFQKEEGSSSVLSIDTRTLPNGVYLLAVISESEYICRKFLVIHQ